MHDTKRWGLLLVDILIVPMVFLSAILLRIVRQLGVQRLPRSRTVLLWVGLFPIRKHYYEPRFDYRQVKRSFSEERPLPAVDWNIEAQRKLMTELTFANELFQLPTQKPEGYQFYFGNGAFESGDAEFWYQIIRLKKPRRIIEIGGGYSTLIGALATQRNREASHHDECIYTCVEPYENRWLEQIGVRILRTPVENVNKSLFQELEENDILFIDSSHMIRPQGDVLYEYFEIIPELRRGVIVQIHDVFSPRDYLADWYVKEVRFWNEQYLLEAFLSYNTDWKVLASLNYLHHHYYSNLKKIAPYLTPDREPGSLYMLRTT